MPSPFPGMAPHLERDEVWPDFHHRLIVNMADALADQVDPAYLVKIREREFLEPEFERQTYLEIRDRASREVVTVLELLSHTNKGRHRDQYLVKRDKILAGSAHLVEMDLLRGGEPMPSPDRPACDYSVVVSRAERRPEADFWPIGLRDPLPTIPIPLRGPDRDATLDLQALLNRVYDAGRYARYVYEDRPQPPSAPMTNRGPRGCWKENKPSRGRSSSESGASARYFRFDPFGP